MASSKKGLSIASKLFQNLKRYEYRDYCQSMIEQDAVLMCDYHKLLISGTHFIDVRQCFIDNIFNPSHVLDYFTRFSSLNCLELRKQVIDIVKSDREYWVHVASVVLLLRPQSFDEWLAIMEDPRGPCDEMFIYVLSKVHFRHTIVYNMKRPWCTIQHTESLSDDELHAACDLHMIYLGHDVYGELMCLVGAKESLQVYDACVTVIEMLPKPTPAPGNTSANTNKVLLVNSLPQKVETHVPAITTDDPTLASNMKVDTDRSSPDNDSLEYSSTPVSPHASQVVNPLLPLWTSITLPL